MALDFVVEHLSRQLHRQVFRVDSAESLHRWCFPFVLVSSDERHIHPVSLLYLVAESGEIELALYKIPLIELHGVGRDRARKDLI